MELHVSGQELVQTITVYSIIIIYYFVKHHTQWYTNKYYTITTKLKPLTNYYYTYTLVKMRKNN